MRLIVKRILLLASGLLLLVIPILAVQILGSLSRPDQTQAELEAALQSGKPVLVAFYSTNCKYCKADEPVLKDLERDLNGALVIVRVNVQGEYGKTLAQEAGIRGVPAYFLLDTATGEILYSQAGPLRVESVIEVLP